MTWRCEASQSSRCVTPAQQALRDTRPLDHSISDWPLFTRSLLLLADVFTMFVYLKHGDNEQFLINTNCPIILLLEHVKAKLELSKTDLVDLCDEGGALKLLFLSQQQQDCARPLLPPRCSYTVCSVSRRAIDGAYVSISPLLVNPDPALLETLQTQTDSLEKARLIQLSSQEDGRCPKTVKSKRHGRAALLDTVQEKILPQTGRRRRRS